mgnify:CR=1 FL=1
MVCNYLIRVSGKAIDVAIIRLRLIALLALKRVVFLCVIFLMANQSMAGNLAVLYPEIREPYRQVFLNIAEGVSDNYSGPTTLMSLEKGESAEVINRRLKKHNIDAVITLGRRGLRVIESLPPAMPKAVVVGGVIVHPNGHGLNGISLSPSPERLLSTLLKLQPKVKNIYVIYQPGPGEWLIKRAQKACDNLGLTLTMLSVSDIHEQAAQYRKLLGDMKRGTDALWVSHDSSRLDKSIMKMVLERSWRRKLTIFSSNLVDMKRGVLFSLYPDNHAMGESLASMIAAMENAIHPASGSTLQPVADQGRQPISTFGISPVRDLLTAVNVRTANHIGLHFNKKQRSEFGMSYPSK